MKKLLIEAPLNSLSFGNVSYNILREISKMEIDVGLFPVGNPDLSAFEQDSLFNDWLQKSINQRWDVLTDKPASFKLWHLNGGENRKSQSQSLLTFYECSEPTKQEISVCKSQDRTFFSSNYAKSLFEDSGCDNCSFVPMGFDSDFHVNNKNYLSGVVHFGLMGKFEKRKHTEKIIKAWLKKFGNDNRYQLTCCVTNPFFKPEQMQTIIASVLDGKRYTNINFLPYLKTNKEVNELMNAIDIDLTGLSGAEGWNLPSFNATCLGKWSVVLNATSHKDWANSQNSILVEPSKKIPVYDNFFFSKGSEYNQGEIFDWNEDEVIAAMQIAADKHGSVNTEGLKLSKEMTYKNTADKIISSIFQ
jgi:hypothetical protein